MQSFPFTTSAGSPNGTTIFGALSLNASRATRFTLAEIVFDNVHSLLYMCDIQNNRLIILNITEDNAEVMANAQLTAMNGSIRLRPYGIVVDEKSDSFYVTDTTLNIIVKFKFGSTTGTIIAGGLISSSIVNQLRGPIGLAFDQSGYLYIVDRGYNRIIQLLNEQGDLRTVVGKSYQYFSLSKSYFIIV